MRRSEKLPSITGRLLLVIMLLVVISNMTIGIISYTLHFNQYLTNQSDLAQQVASSLAFRIDGDKFDEIIGTLEKNDYWYEVQEYANNLAEEFNTVYLYVIDDDYSSGELLYFGEGSTVDEPYELGDIEALYDENGDSIYADEMFETISTGAYTNTAPYESGEYGEMVSGFAPIYNNKGEITGVVGADLSFKELRAEANMFGISIFAIILIFLAISCIILLRFGKTRIGEPLTILDASAKQLASGDMDIRVDIQSNTEIGRLSESFNKMVEDMKKQVEALQGIAKGDLTVDIHSRGDRDVMGHSIIEILKNLNEMLNEVKSSAFQVSDGSQQISQGAQSLADCAVEQSSAVERLSASINDMSAVTAKNAENTAKASSLANIIMDDARVGTEKMENLTKAVDGITEASLSIGKVIKVIDDIAFQTNILALNASVEAARAGTHGKGFAVVANEVRNLATRSAKAAKETDELIANSIERAKLGASIAKETAESLEKIITGISESTVVVNEIAKTFEGQNGRMSQIGYEIDNVSRIAEQNNSTAEESAAASVEMSMQSKLLHDLLNNFKIKE